MNIHFTLSFLLWLVASLFKEGLSTQPNVILFVLDDYDYTDSMSESMPETSIVNDYLDINTTWISKIRDEGFIFPSSYTGGPKSGPSRYSLLTGRYPSRASFAIYRTNRQATSYDGYNGTYIDSTTAEINGSIDSFYNIPNILRRYANYTSGLVGLYNLLYQYEDYCGDMTQPITDIPGMETLYNECIAKVEKYGFDFVDGLYIVGIDEDNGVFSHNPEWLVTEAIDFIDDAVNNQEKPFFLYFGSTLSGNPSTFDAMFRYELNATPKGYLTGGDVPDSSVMKGRNATWDAVIDAGWKGTQRRETVRFLC